MEHHGQQWRQNPQQRRGQQPASGSASAGNPSATQQEQDYAFQIDGAQYPMTYGTAGTQALSDTQQEQSTGQYIQYSPNMTYDIDQPQAAQFGMPGPSQYYTTAPPRGLQILGVPSQFGPSSFPPSDPSIAGQTFPIDPTQSTAYNLYAQQQPQTYDQPPTQMSTTDPLAAIQTQFRQIFTLARDDALRDAGARLLEMSHYLLGNVETFDDQTQHDARIRLWDGFNRVWLVTLQRQLDLTQQGSTAAVMDVETLERMSGDLIGLCDSIEKHGLVDYQMGVAEDEIVEMILRCISALKPISRGSSQRGGSSSAGASRRRGR